MSNMEIKLSSKGIERFWNKVNKKNDDECWEWTANTLARGYGRICINNKMYLAHRVSWVIHNGAIPDHNSYHGICVCHTCDNPCCVNPAHLFLGTNKENLQDMQKKGRLVNHKGEKHGSHKLTEKEVIEIREKYIPYKYTQSKLAKEYGVTQVEIYYILKYITWKHIHAIKANPPLVFTGVSYE